MVRGDEIRRASSFNEPYSRQIRLYSVRNSLQRILQNVLKDRILLFVFTSITTDNGNIGPPFSIYL